MMTLIGYDLLVIDTEHGPAALSETADMMRGITRTDAGAVVRVPANRYIRPDRKADKSCLDGAGILEDSDNQSCQILGGNRRMAAGRSSGYTS
jgi:hypothetical protein